MVTDHEQGVDTHSSPGAQHRTLKTQRHPLGVSTGSVHAKPDDLDKTSLLFHVLASRTGERKFTPCPPSQKVVMGIKQDDP